MVVKTWLGDHKKERDLGSGALECPLYTVLALLTHLLLSKQFEALKFWGAYEVQRFWAFRRCYRGLSSSRRVSALGKREIWLALKSHTKAGFHKLHLGKTLINDGIGSWSTQRQYCECRSLIMTAMSTASPVSTAGVHLKEFAPLLKYYWKGPVQWTERQGSRGL